MTAHDLAFKAKLEELLGERVKAKDNSAVRWRDLPKLRVQMEALATKVVEAATGAGQGGTDGGGTGGTATSEEMAALLAEMEAVQARIDAAELEAQNALAAVQNAVAAADGARAYTDSEVERARNDLRSDYDTAIQASGQAQAARDAAQAARDVALGAKTGAAAAQAAAQSARDLAVGAQVAASDAVIDANDARDKAIGARSGASEAAIAAADARDKALASKTSADGAAAAAAGSASTAAAKATEAGQSSTAATAEAAKATTARGGAEAARDQAAISKTDAASSANRAEASATVSAGSATLSGQKADAAAGSAAVASTKANEAGQQASAASAEATKASTARGGAEAARDQASVSETNAKGAASSAAASAKLSADARDAAGGSAAAAAGSASTASAKANEAGQQASAALASSITAATKAGDASVFATQAASSASTADTKAKDADISAKAAAASVVQANTGAARVLPAEVNSTYWRQLWSGPPGSNGLLWDVVVENGYARFPMKGPGNRVALTQATIPLIPGRTYRITPDARANEIAQPIEMRLLVAGLDANLNYVRSISTGLSYPLPVAGEWTASSREYVMAPSDGVTQVRMGLWFRSDQAGADGTIDVRSILVEDVTALKSSEAAASASASSASAADASKTAAGQFASAAQADATKAATARGGAETARDAAAQSKTDAAGSASSASNSATAAAGSATAAGQKADAAAGSASTASTKATEAGQSATAAAAEATKATTARGGAETARDQASASKTDAAGSASSASNSATAAAGSATAAGQKADAAASSATQASSSATAAGQSAAAAASSKLSAETAKAGADTARTDSVVAKQDAEAAAAGARSSFEMTARMGSSGLSVIRDQYLSDPAWTIHAGNGTLQKRPNEIYPVGQTWQWNLTATEDSGVFATSESGSFWPGQTNAPGYVLEIEFTRISGDRGGTGAIVRWDNTAGGQFFAKMSLVDMDPGLGTYGRTQVARGVFLKPASFTGTFSKNLLCFYANNSAGLFGPMVAKQIKIHRISIRPATDEEMGGGQVAAAVQAKLLQEYLTRADTQSAIAALNTTLSARFDSNEASISSTATSLANTQQAISTFSFLATAGNGASAGLRAVAIAKNGTAITSVLQLIGDNVIAPGTLSTNALLVGLGKNLLIDPTLADGTAHWGNSTYLLNVSYGVRGVGASYASKMYPSLEIAQTNGATDGYADFVGTPIISASGARAPGVPVTAGSTYILSAYVSSHRASASLYIYFLNADGGVISTPGKDVGQTGGAAYDPESWTRGFVKATAPTGAVTARVHFRKWGTYSGQANSYAFFYKPQFEETHAEATGPSPWSPGGTTFINGGRLFADSVTGREVAAESIEASHLVKTKALITASAQIGSGLVGSLQIADVIQSTGFVSGENGQGWRILKTGAAEFNDVTIRRQIEVASGTVNVGTFNPRTQYLIDTSSGGNTTSQHMLGEWVNLANGPGAVVSVMTTPVPISAWLGAKKTYLANVGMTGTVTSGNSANAYWGWTADVLPLTKWSGDQSLRLRLCFWSQAVAQVQNCVLTWKIYEVS